MAINLCDPENLACQVTTTAWDCCHKVSETEPDGSTTTWDYDDEGRMIASLRLIPLDMTNVTWLATCYEHDGFGQDADVWVPVGMNNELSDTAGSMELAAPWGSGGEMTWPIPNNYRSASTNSSGVRFCDTDQTFTLTSGGTVSVEKFDWYVTVTTNRIISYGRK